MKKLVTNLLDNICLCRDLLQEGNVKSIYSRLHIFENVVNEAKRQLNKFIDSKSHELDFMSLDLKALSEEIHDFLKQIEPEFDYNVIMSRMETFKIVNDRIITSETNRLADLMQIDKKLRECYKLLSYLALIQELWTQARKG